MRKRKQKKQSLYAGLVIFTEPIRLEDPPLDELPTPAAAWQLETVPFPLWDGCAPDCPARQN